MTFNEISMKLMRSNRKQYVLFFFSVLLAIAVTGAYGVLQYSPTITNVLIDGGSTYTIAQSMFLGTMFGIVVFLIYANHLFFKYKSKEIGIFLSLGIDRNTVKKMITKEFNYIFIPAALIGLILATPFSYVCWSFLTMFLETKETVFVIGWKGLFIVFVFTILSWLILCFANQNYIKKIEVMKILKFSDENERSKTAHLSLLISSSVSIPIGIVSFFYFNNIGGFIPTIISCICIVVATKGIYVFIIQLASIGDILRKYNVKAYYKNIVLYNLLKQKILGYTRSIFVATLLITFTIFGIGFSAAAFINGYNQAINEPYDYTVHTINNDTDITEIDIFKIAENTNTDITTMKKLNSILIGVQNNYSDGYTDWGSKIAVSQSSFNAFTGYNISVSSGSYLLYHDISKEHKRNAFFDDNSLIYNPTTKQEIQLSKDGFITGDKLFNTASFFDSFLIFNDKDFEEFSAHLGGQYKLTSYIMNIEDWEMAKEFEDAILQTIIADCEGEIFANWFNSAVFHKTGREAECLTYQGNETKVARIWSLYPVSKLSDTTIKIDAFAVYLLLMLFIAIIAFVSSTMIISLKIISTIWGDIKVYTSIKRLGMKRKDIERIITKQMTFIYFIPTIIGCLVGAFTTYQISLIAKITFIGETMLFVGGICVIVAIFQIIMYFIMRSQILKRYLLIDK